MATGRTFDLGIMVGTSAWLVDLTAVSTGASVDGSANITREAALKRRYESATRQSAQHSISVPRVYVGAETEALRGRQGSGDMPWVCVFDEKNDLAYVMESLLTGVPEQAPTSDVIATSLTFPQANRFFASAATAAVTRFELAAGDLSEDIGTIPADRQVFLIVDEADLTSARALTITGFSARQIANDGVGIWNQGKTNAAQNSATVATTGLTGTQKINGYVLVVEERGA